MGIFGTLAAGAIARRVALALALASGGVAATSLPATAVAVPESTPAKRLKRLIRIVIPRHHRVENWGPSCGHAVTCTLLNHAGQHEMARWVRKHRAGPSTLQGIADDLQSKGYQCRFTDDFRDVERAIDEGKPVGYRCPPAHARTLVRLDRLSAVYIDPNSPDREVEVSRLNFISQWNEGGRCALIIDHYTERARSEKL